MLKAIFAKDVKEGDVIILSGGKWLTVRYVGRRGADRVDLLTKEEGSVGLGEYDVVELVHRPWPVGKTEADVKKEIMEVVDRLGSQRNHPVADCWLADLRKLLEVYELGKPLE